MSSLCESWSMTISSCHHRYTGNGKRKGVERSSATKFSCSDTCPFSSLLGHSRLLFKICQLLSRRHLISYHSMHQLGKGRQEKKTGNRRGHLSLSDQLLDDRRSQMCVTMCASQVKIDVSSISRWWRKHNDIGRNRFSGDVKRMQGSSCTYRAALKASNISCKSLLVLFLSCPIKPFPATTFIPVWTQWHSLMKMERYLLRSGCHQGRGSDTPALSCPTETSEVQLEEAQTNALVWGHACKTTAISWEPVGQHGSKGSWVAAESSAAILHQGLAKATWPLLLETAQAALKPHSFIFMHGFTYSCILNRSTNGHNWIHYWVIRALSHCLCSFTWCWGNAQEEQTGQSHGQWQGL